MKQTPNASVILKLEKLIKQKRGTINASEAAVATGYSIDEINTGFSRMIELYESKVSMDYSTGAVVYNFAYPLKPRGKKSFKEIMTSVGEAAYKVFKKVYKVAIGVILIVYTVLFAVILLAAMVAGSSNRDNDRGGGGIRFDFLINIFMSIIHGMQMAAITRNMVEYSTDSYGMRYQTVRKDKKNFIASVYDFVFGPERVPQDPLDDAKEVVAYLKKQSEGKLTAGSILLLSGGNYDSAESKLAEYSGRFEGDLQITTDAVLVSEFYHLQAVEPSWLDGKIVYYFDEAEAPWVLTGNTTGRNFAVIAMNAFNLVFSSILIGTYFNNALMAFALGFFPLVFSILFFLVPLFRIFYNMKRNKERKESILKKKLFRGIIKNVHTSASQEQIFADGGVIGEEFEDAKAVFEKSVIDYAGEINISEMGTPLYSFRRLSQELKIA